MDQNLQVAHPNSQDLQAFARGQLRGASQREIEQHLAQCGACCEALSAVSDDDLMNRLRSQKSRAVETTGAPIQDTAGYASGASPESSGETDVAPKELVGHRRYRILKKIGAGGMGEVFQAEHRMMERVVALKVINRRLTSNPSALQRFEQEVKAAAKLSHRNIVTAYDAEQAEDLHFLVMEYVPGESLDRVVKRRGPLPVVNACNYIRQAALGLEHAYEHGMTHRDIKPQNMMLTREGIVKILDFGLARFAADHDCGDGPSNTSLTASGMIVGTPDYMAPEQAKDSHAADIRSDIYSLGCTFYYLLSGHPPFPEGSVIEKMASHLKDEPTPLDQLRMDFPSELTWVLARMLAKNPQDRFQTPAEVANALAPFSTRQSQTLATMFAAPAARGESLDGSEFDNAIESAAQYETNSQANATLPSRKLPSRKLPAMNFLSVKPWLPNYFQSSHRFAMPVAIAVIALVVILTGGWIVSGIIHPADDSINSTGNESVSSSDGKSNLQSRGVKRIVMVVPHQNFWHPDYQNVLTAFENAGAHVKLDIASSAPGYAVGVDNVDWPTPMSKLPVDRLLSDVRAAQYDTVIFIGATPVKNIEFMEDPRWREQAKRVAQEFRDQEKVVTGVCGGIGVLAKTGVLRGAHASRCPYIPDTIHEQGGAIWNDAPVTACEEFITARDAFSADAFVAEVLKYVK